jgi:hypothetical protein
MGVDLGAQRVTAGRDRHRRGIMSRSGYSDDADYSEWSYICWRGAVESAIRGKRGQAFLKELLAALEALPERKLVYGTLTDTGEGVCALGAIAKARGVSPEVTGSLDRRSEDEDDISHSIASVLDIPRTLAAEIMFENDEGCSYVSMTDEARWDRIHRWVKKAIRS